MDGVAAARARFEYGVPRHEGDDENGTTRRNPFLVGAPHERGRVIATQRFLFVLPAVLVLTAAQGLGESAGGSAPTAPDTSPRSGETIKVGYVNTEAGALSFPQFRVGGEVAIDAINAAGGINGAQIEVVSCLSDGTPEGAINCANQLIEADVVMAYMGIELASEAAIGLWVDAGIPYVSSNSWGTTEKNSPNAFLLHAAAGAFAVGPAKTFEDLGVESTAVIFEDNPGYQVFLDEAVEPVFSYYGIEYEPIIVNPQAPDWTAAVATAEAAGVDAIWAQLSEPGCLGLIGATTAAEWDKPVFAGSCSSYVDALGDAAVGTYLQTDVWPVSAKSHASPEVQDRIDEFVELMTAAGHQDMIGAYAQFPYGSWREIEPILESIDGPIDAASVLDAFTNAGTTPGWFGPDLRCGLAPWPPESSHCSAEIAVFRVEAADDGTIGLVPVGDGFFDAFQYSGLSTETGSTSSTPSDQTPASSQA